MNINGDQPGFCEKCSAMTPGISIMAASVKKLLRSHNSITFTVYYRKRAGALIYSARWIGANESESDCLAPAERWLLFMFLWHSPNPVGHWCQLIIWIPSLSNDTPT